MSNIKTFSFICAAMILMSGCSAFTDDDAPPLEGERISVLQLEKSLEPDDTALEEQGLITPAPWKNAFWPQKGGYPNHAMQNLALGESPLKRIWSADIGKGSSDQLPLNAQPVLVDGEIYTLDTQSNPRAFNAETGKKLWSVDVSKKDEDDEVISGGLAYASGVLYVTNGFNEVLAVHPTDGEILWRKAIPAPARAAPTVLDGRLYVVTLDNRLLALRADDGNLLWDHTAFSESASLVGAASPAADSEVVIPAFSSGELTALRVENGSVAWSDNLSNVHSFGGLETLSDIRALPVIDKGMVFAISFSGKLVAIDERTGQRLWQREIGGSNTPWLAGNHIFLLSSDNELVALARNTGAISWVTKIENKDNDDEFFFTGPVLAGNRLIIAGSDGAIIEIEPEHGEIINQWDAGDTIILPPIVANETLYLLDEDGTLSAYR